MAMVEVTNRCNLTCPICFSDAVSRCDDPSLDQIETSMKGLLDITGTPIPLQISGGEPTVRNDLPEIVSMAVRLGYRHIDLITNGIRIAQSPSMLAELKENGLTAVYLQFDGLTRESGLKIRGQDLRNVRHEAIEAVRTVGICCTLAVTVVRGVNDRELGDIIKFGIGNIDTVRAISFQAAVPFTGRFHIEAPVQPLTLDDLIARIATQMNIPAETFLSEPLGHPSCNAGGYIFVKNGKMMPLFRYVSPSDIASFLGSDCREKLLDLFGGKDAYLKRYLVKPAFYRIIAKAAPIFGFNPLKIGKIPHIFLFAEGF